MGRISKAEEALPVPRNRNRKDERPSVRTERGQRVQSTGGHGEGVLAAVTVVKTFARFLAPPRSCGSGTQFLPCPLGLGTTQVIQNIEFWHWKLIRVSCSLKSPPSSCPDMEFENLWTDGKVVYISSCGFTGWLKVAISALSLFSLDTHLIFVLCCYNHKVGGRRDTLPLNTSACSWSWAGPFNNKKAFICYSD